jgi:hypothetical protein
MDDLVENKSTLEEKPIIFTYEVQNQKQGLVNFSE